MSEFKEIVRRTMETLPAEFQPYLHNVVVDVAEEPDIPLLQRAGFTDEEIAEGDTLFGLFEPLELTSSFGGDSISINDLPHRLWIFKNPHEEEFPEPERLRTEIRKTVIHELAHHFDWTDRDLERFDDNPNPFRNAGD
jgi:predicted Zn-dependent protease with MMP-like domain